MDVFSVFPPECAKTILTVFFERNALPLIRDLAILTNGPKEALYSSRSSLRFATGKGQFGIMLPSERSKTDPT